MSTEYFNSLNSLCSSSFHSYKRREILDGDFKSTEIDNESMMEYTADSSTKASSSSIQESIANMSNSHSTPEDNSSENALSSPFAKQTKPDCEKCFDTSSNHTNGIFESLSVASNVHTSIDDTIESVLSKIRDENGDAGFLLSYDTSFETNVSSVCASKRSDQSDISLSVTIANDSQDLDNLQYSKGSYPSASCQNSNTQSSRLNTTLYHNNCSIQNFPNNLSQQFYNYGNYYNVPNNFPNQVNMSNYNRASLIKDVDKNSFFYHQYQFQNPSFRQYMPNSYINQQYYRQESKNVSVQPSYQMFQKPQKRESNYDQVIIENEHPQYGINFKTPQPSSCGFIDSTVRKKRPMVDPNKLTPTKKRKLINQFALSNNYEDLVNKLKTKSYNSLLVNPSLKQNRSLLPPLEFTEPRATEIVEKPVKYYKYKSSSYSIIKPRQFNGDGQSDRFLSNYIFETISGKGPFISDRCNTDGEGLSDIVCMTPESEWQSEKHLLVHMHLLDPPRDANSPILSTPQVTDSQIKEHLPGCEIRQICDFKPTSIPFMTSIVAYNDNDAKLVTQIHSTRERYSKAYVKLSGSFLKRTKINGKSFSSVHIEEAVSVASLTASRNDNSCRYCCTFLTGLSSIKISGRELGLDCNEEYIFCSTSCYANFKSDTCSNYLFNKPSSTTNGNVQSTQVLIKTTPYKPPKNYKKVCDFEQYVRRRFPSEGQSDGVIKYKTISETDKKRLLGVNYWYYKNEKVTPLCTEFDREDQTHLLQKYTLAYRSLTLVDIRLCALCQGIGDDIESVCGRLMNINGNVWVHLNCGLWCFDVFETVSGSLMGVQSALQRASKTQCSSCNKFGAGLQCYRNKCTLVYHVPCAYKIGCIFYTDRGMYCASHAVLNHPMHLPTLNVERRVSVFRDECALVADVVLEDQDVKYKIRTGTLTLNMIGQLLPEQLICGKFNSRSIIYPIGYHATRIYWSPVRVNRRCKYECHIDEDNGAPLFKVTYLDIEDCEVVVSDRSCDNLWKNILYKIAQLRQDSGLTRLFPLYLSGEQLHGLTESHIVRVIESLPGVEMIKNYAFKFGKLQLITEMPLAINPTGCARTEMKLRTYVRRSQELVARQNPCGILKAKSSQQLFIFEPLGLHKILASNSRAQQYKRLQCEWVNNVVLARSNIQGLGLFASKDIDKSTMIIEYIGETIRNEVGNRREQLYQSRNNSIYMFRLNDDLIIDATVHGGLARYINHSCQPNCVAEFLSLDCGSRIIISTKQRIERGEELTYDYKFDFEDDTSERIPCLCGAINCRRWMN